MRGSLTDSVLRATKVRWSYIYIEQVLGPTEKVVSLEPDRTEDLQGAGPRRYQGLNWPGRITERGLRTVSLPRTRGHTEDRT